MASRKTFIDHLGEKGYEKERLVNDDGYVVSHSVGVRYIQDLTEPKKSDSSKPKHHYYELLSILQIIVFGFFGIWALVNFLTTRQFQIPPIVSFMCVVIEFFFTTWFSFLKSQKYKFPIREILFHHFGIFLYPLSVCATTFWAINVYILSEGNLVKFFFTAIILSITSLGAGQKLSKSK